MTATDPLREAFDLVPRVGFLPPDQHRFAGDDRALPIGYGQTNSQPSTVLAMLRLLDVRPGQRILDVGCGSGWTTALLGHLVGPAGEVHGVEVVPELVEWGAGNVAARTMPWASVHAAQDGELGLPELAPFDRVLVSAEATRIPRSLVEQLVEGGVMVVPVSGRMTVVRRTAGAPQVSHEGWYSFVPLREP